jgi:hypothetical protein
MDLHELIVTRLGPLSKAKGREGWDRVAYWEKTEGEGIEGREGKEERREGREEEGKERFCPWDLRLDPPVLKYYDYRFYIIDLMPHNISCIYS